MNPARGAGNPLRFAPVAILLLREITGFTVVERSRKGTGFDYWLGKPGSPPFPKKARLEVSGILDGTAGEVAG